MNRKPLFISLLCALVICGFGCPSEESPQPVAAVVDSQNIYVKADATGKNDGSTWQNAFTNIQQAVDEAHRRFLQKQCPQHVWVAQGTYVNENKQSPNDPVLTMQDNVFIEGGFEGREEYYVPPEQRKKPSVLDGQHQSTHVVVGASNAALRGFRIINGNARGTSPKIHDKVGAGLFALGAKFLDLAWLEFEWNQALLVADDFYMEKSHGACNNINSRNSHSGQTSKFAVVGIEAQCPGSNVAVPPKKVGWSRSYFGQLYGQDDAVAEDIWRFLYPNQFINTSDGLELAKQLRGTRWQKVTDYKTKTPVEPPVIIRFDRDEDALWFESDNRGQANDLYCPSEGSFVLLRNGQMFELMTKAPYSCINGKRPVALATMHFDGQKIGQFLHRDVRSDEEGDYKKPEIYILLEESK